MNRPLASLAFGLGAMGATFFIGKLVDPLELSTKYQPARLIGGARKPEALKYIVLHSTESTGTAAAVASYFQSPSSGGSSQVVVGEDGAFQCVPDLRQPAGAPGANSDGLHIEVVGLAKWTREEWLSRAPKALRRCAEVLGQWARDYKIPLAFLDAADLKEGVRRGVTTHYEVSQAFKQSDHWDPGKGFPLDYVLEMARLCA